MKRPVHTSPSGPDSPERRRFLTRLTLALVGLIGAVVTLPILGYLLAPLIRPPRPQWIDVGPLDAFPIGETKLTSFRDISPLPYAGLTAQTAIYVQRNGPQELRVFAVNCTHLGCPVNWMPNAQIFLCPCHGGVYYRDGSVASGPPQHPLPEYTWRIVNARLEVQTRPLPPATPWQPPLPISPP